MVMSGMSYRKASDHINFSHNIPIPHNTIIIWVQKFSKIIKMYVDTLKPITDDVSAGKYHTLIPMAASKNVSENRKITQKLGNYNDCVSVFASGDVIKVEPKGWLESEQWRDICNILTSIGFTWFFNSNVRSWIRFGKTPFEKKVTFASQAPIGIK